MTTPARLAVLLAAASAAHAGLRVDRTLCEYEPAPIGLDTPSPRLTWSLASDVRGDRPTAFRIFATSSEAGLAADRGDLWDTGRVESDAHLHVPYSGRPLRCGDRVHWKVRAWGRGGNPTPWSAPAAFEMGPMTPADWAGAAWIALAEDTRPPEHRGRDMQTKPMPAPARVDAFPAPRLRREFDVPATVRRARLHVCALGLGEAWINGKRVGDAVLDPAQTTYDVRSFYVTHDVTKHLRRGRNAVGLWLGNGFHGQNVGFTRGLAWGPPRALARLAIEFADGTTRDIVTDASWQAATGAVLFDNLYAGETFDARLDDPAWSAPGGGEGWPAVRTVPSPTARLQAQTIPPMRRIRALKPAKVVPAGGRRWIVDFGQNLAGWVRIVANEPAGTTVTMRFAELLSPDGTSLDTASTGVFATGVEQTDVLICRDGVTDWEPRFTYHGFRYCEIDGLASAPTAETIEAWLVRTDVPEAGAFECSDPLLNRIHTTSMWTIADNLHGTSEDCPHRERCGWLGDAHAVGETAIFNFGMGPFWAKFLDDMETVHGRGGVTYTKRPAQPGIPCNIAVGRRLCQEARPDWGAACTLLPWYLYVYYGDLDVARRHYPHMVRWVDYVEALTTNGIVREGYGDWCPPGGNERMDCPFELTSTAFHYASLRHVETFARLLGRPGEAAGFARRAEATKTAFLRWFTATNAVDFGSQTANSVALRFGLFPEGRGDELAAALARRVKAAGGHHHTGIHGARWLYTGLSDRGRDGAALLTLTAKGFPGYADLLARGCTTWPEVELPPAEDAAWRGRSHNHPMQSGFAAWFHEGVAGIRPDPEKPGFGGLLMRPAAVKALEWVRASHDSLRGPIASEWRRDGKAFEWTIRLPPGSTARVQVPAGKASSATEGGRPVAQAPDVAVDGWTNGWTTLRIGSGEYRFQSALP